MIDDIQILSDQMYGVMDAGVQVAQKPIPDNLKSLSDRRLRLALREMENLPEEQVAAPLPPTETPAQVPHHVHPEYLDVVPDHTHPFQEHVHYLRNEDEARLAGLEFDSKIRDADLLKITGELRGDILRHEHPGYAVIDHQHADLRAGIELLDRKLEVESQHVHELAPADPRVAQLVDQLGEMRNTTTMMSLMLERLTNRVIELENRPIPESIKPDMEEINRLRDEFATHIADMNNRPVYYTAEISNFEQGGARKFVVQEAPR